MKAIDIKNKNVYFREGSGSRTGITQGERVVNPPKAESKVWKELKNFREGTKTNGLSGKDKRYYQWDPLHNEIEMYDKNGKPIDALDPVTGNRLYKDVKDHRPIDI